MDCQHEKLFIGLFHRSDPLDASAEVSREPSP